MTAAAPRCVDRADVRRQRLLDWSGHVESWRSAPFPVLVVRYGYDPREAEC